MRDWSSHIEHTSAETQKRTSVCMKLGVILPQYEIGLDSGALRAFARAVEDLGYQYLVAFDSLCTENPWHEPLVFYAFLAGWTQKLELAPGVIVVPSRQTLLLAKQAASRDVLSGWGFRHLRLVVCDQNDCWRNCSRF